MSIKFIQFLRPFGTRKPIFIDLEEEYDTLGNEIIDMGMKFQIEQLSVGEISMSISDGEQDLVIRVCNNGPEVPENVKSMIDEFTKG